MRQTILDWGTHFSLIDCDGNYVEYEILLTFDATNKHYIVFTNHEKDELNQTRVYACYYDPENFTFVDPIPITEEKEYRLIENILNEVINNLEDNENE